MSSSKFIPGASKDPRTSIFKMADFEAVFLTKSFLLCYKIFLPE